MPNNSENVKFGKPVATGAIYCGSADATVPTSASADLTGFDCIGYAGDKGLKEKVTRDTGETKAWGGDVVARPQTKFGREYDFDALEVNPFVLKAVYGEDNVSVGNDGNIAITCNSKELPYGAWVFDIALDYETVMRKVLPRAKVVTVGEVEYVDGNPVKYPITLAEFPDEHGEYEYIYIASVDATSPGSSSSSE